MGLYYEVFEDLNSQPPELKKVMDKWQDRLVSGLTYESAVIGYKFDMGLDAEPYGLGPIGIGIQELKGFENI